MRTVSGQPLYSMGGGFSEHALRVLLLLYLYTYFRLKFFKRQKYRKNYLFDGKMGLSMLLHKKEAHLMTDIK